jgi:ribose 1,5-bisphosphokinase
LDKTTMRPDSAPARVYLLVGPSGAGKDTVLQALAARLAPEDGLAIARRVITRPTIPGAPEQHVAVTSAAFARLRAAGAFALDWESHAHAYGIGTEIRLWLAAGVSVIANGSRAALPAARARFGTALTIIHLTASPATLARRLAERGREDPRSIKARLRRTPDLTYLRDCPTIENEGSVDEAVASLHRIVTGVRCSRSLSQR